MPDACSSEITLNIWEPLTMTVAMMMCTLTMVTHRCRGWHHPVQDIGSPDFVMWSHWLNMIPSWSLLFTKLCAGIWHWHLLPQLSSSVNRLFNFSLSLFGLLELITNNGFVHIVNGDCKIYRKKLSPHSWVLWHVTVHVTRDADPRSGEHVTCHEPNISMFTTWLGRSDSSDISTLHSFRTSEHSNFLPHGYDACG